MKRILILLFSAAMLAVSALNCKSLWQVETGVKPGTVYAIKAKWNLFTGVRTTVQLCDIKETVLQCRNVKFALND